MTRRIVLAELGENARWASSPIGTGISLSSDGKTVSRAGAATNSSARTIVGRTSRRLFFAAKVNSLGTGSNGVWLGVCTSNAPNNVSTGADAEQWALWSGLGGTNQAQRQHNGSASAYATSPAFSVNSYMVVCVDYDLGYLWFGHATSLASGTAITWLNPSADPVTSANPDYTDLLTAGVVKPSVKRRFHLLTNPYAGGGASLTLVTDRMSLGAICPSGFTPYGEFAFIATESFIAQPSNYFITDLYFAPRIAADGDPTYTRGVSVAQWQRSGANIGTPIGNTTLNDPAGDLDSWSKYDLRDMAVRYLMGAPTDTYPFFVQVASAVIERLESDSEDLKRLIHKDTLALLDTELQKNVYTSSVPNSSLEGKPLPLCFGLCTWVPFVTADQPNLEYHIHDDEWGGVVELRDQGVAITAITGWDYGSRTDAVGVRRLTNPAGKQVATVKGQVTLGSDVLSGNGAFTSWTTDNPNGWTVTETSPSLVTQTVAGTARFVRSTAVTLQAVSTSNVLTNGQLYYATIQCTAWVSGALLVKDGLGNTLLSITKVGTYRFGFVAAGTTTLGLYMTSNGDVSVDNFFCYSATLVERITTIVPYIIRDRLGLESSLYDTTSLSDLDTAAAYKHGFYVDNGARAIDVLRAVLRGYTGDLWVDNSNKIRVGRLAEPVLGGHTIFSNIEVVGPLKIRPDNAPGLSDRLAGVKNYGVHSETDIAGSVINVGSGQLAAQLQEAYLAVKKGATAVAGVYDFARAAEPIETLLSDAAQTQTEASRMTALWSKPRVFIEFDAIVEGGLGYMLAPFSTHVLNLEKIPYASSPVADRYGLLNHPAVLVQITSRPLSDLCNLVVWCELPAFLDPVKE